MKIIGIWAAVIVVLYAAQTSLLTLIDFNGVSVNFMLLFTVSAAFLRGPSWGVLFGFVTGILQDSTTGSFFGCATFSFMTAGFFFGMFSSRVFKEQFFLPVVSSIFAGALHFLIMIAFVFLLGYRPDFVQMIYKILMPFLIFQVIFSWPVHKLVYTLDKYARESKR